MPLIPVPTKGKGDCAFHAACGQWDENAQKYVYHDIQAIRERVADTVRISIAGQLIFPSIFAAIDELIRSTTRAIDLTGFPIIQALRTQFHTTQSVDLDWTNRSIIEEYASIIEKPGIWLLPAELSIIAHACQITIRYFIGNRTNPLQIQEYNPGHSIANVYFNGNGHYERMRDEDSESHPSAPVNFLPSAGVSRPQEEEYKASGLKNTLHGNIYQLKLLMLFLHRGYRQGYQFKLATEMDAAEKFDDLVFQYQKPGDPQPKYFFLQAKHKQDNTNTISMNELTDTNDGEFSLTKYFSSFNKIKTRGLFNTGELGTFYLCTNIALDPAIQSKFDLITTPAPLLDSHAPGARRYRIKKDPVLNKEIYAHLGENTEGYKLAHKLVESILNGKNKSNVTLKTPIFKEYHANLAKANIIVKGEFTQDFIKGHIKTNVPAWVKKFRALLITEARKKLGKKLTDITVIQTLADQMKASKTFGVKDSNPIVDLEVDVTDEKIGKFFDHFVLATGQSDEVQLGEIIARELGVEFKLIDASFIYADFQREVLDWMKAKKGTFLTSKAMEAFFGEMSQKLNRLALIGPTLDYQRKLDGPGITFVPNDIVKEFLNLKNTKRVAIYQTDRDLFLAGMQIYQTLHMIPTHRTNDGYIFVTLKKAIRLGSLLIDAFKKSQLLVLSCNMPIEKEASALIDNLFTIATASKTKKIIFITANNQTIENILPDTLTPTIIKGTSGFRNLTLESQKLLGTKSILFQGKITSLDQLSDQLDQIIDAEVLTEILETQTVQVGEVLKSIEDTLYVARSFSHVTITDAALLNDNSDMFALGNIPEDRLKTILGKHRIRRVNEKKLTPEKVARHILLDPDTKIAADQFKQLCSTYPNRRIHFLTRENETWVWQDSQGRVSRLRPYLTTPSETETLNSRYIVLSAEPGMGKSTLLSHFVLKQKKLHPDSWVIQIALLSQEENLKKAHFNDIDDVVTFFTQNTSVLAKKLFSHRLKMTGKLIICLDGFDELQAAQQTKVIQLLQLLKDSKVQQVVITTRQHLQSTLEDTLNTFAYDLIPFEEHDVLNYLQEFWQAELPTENRERIRNYANALIQLFINTVGEARQFIGIPLQARLLGEAFAEDVRIFCTQADQAEPKLPHKLSLRTLYQRFIESKYRILFQNKSNFAQTNLFTLLRDYVIPGLNKDHQYYAFMRLFPEATPPIEPPTQAEEDIQAAGIIHFIHGQPHFIHRTFAEYFTALFFITQLALPAENSEHKKYQAFLQTKIFMQRYQVVRTFMEELIAEKNQLELSNAWKAIEKSALLPIKYPQQSSLGGLPPFTPLPLVSLPRALSFQIAKERLGKSYCANPGDQSSTWHTKQLCQAVLTTNNIEELEEALSLLKNIGFSGTLADTRKVVVELFRDIYWHYVHTCLQQGVLFQTTFILNFDKIDIGRYKYRDLWFSAEKESLTLLHAILEKKKLLNQALQLKPKEINSIFDESRQYSRTPTQKRNWAQCIGIKLANILQILTPSMAEHFNYILLLINVRLLDEYASDIQGKLLKPLITMIQIKPSKIDLVALLSIYQRLIRYYQSSSYRIVTLPLSEIQTFLPLIKKLLNHPALDSEMLTLGIRLLSLLTKEGLVLVDNSTSILILHPVADFTYELQLNDCAALTELIRLSVKNSLYSETPEFTKACTRFLLAKKASSSQLKW